MAKTYNSFAGVDINAMFNDVVFGELQMVSYKSDREKGPVYVMGSVDPVSFARGKRLISGACVFVVFDRDTLLASLGGDDKTGPFLSKNETANFNSTGYASKESKDAALQGGSLRTTSTGVKSDTGFALKQSAIKDRQKAMVHDQILPFDITLVAASEYGKTSKMIIHGVELMTAAGGMSIDDLVIEKQVSFLAHRITDWHTNKDYAEE